MTQFRQKNFFWNLALTGIGTGVSYLQGKSQNEEIQKQGEAQAEANEKQEELLKEQNRKLSVISEKVKSNPAAVSNIQGALQGTRERYYAAPAGGIIKTITNSQFIKNAKGFGKDLLGYVNAKGDKVVEGKLVEGAGKVARRQVLLGNMFMGATAGVGDYAANKIIQADRRRQGYNDTLQKPNQQIQTTQPLPQQKAYSVNWGEMWKGTKNLAKETWKHNKKQTAMGLAFASMPVIQYASTRVRENQQAKLSSTDPNQPSQPTTPTMNPATQKQYSMMSGVVGGFKTLAKHPGRTILGGANKAMSFGAIGQKEIGAFANKMAGSTNKWSNKLGNMMLAKDKAGNILKDEFGNVMANKKALLGTTAISAGVVGGAWSKTEKGVRALTKKIDPNAYAYEENQKQMMDNGNV